MRLAFLLSLLVTASSAVGAEERPTRATLRRAFEHNVHALVEVSGGRRAGAGVVVGSGGQVVTVVDHVTLESAVVRTGNRSRTAKVVAANARLKIAVVEATLDEGEQLSAPAVEPHASLRRGTWLVGMKSGRGAETRPSPVTGRIVAATTASRPFFVTDLPLPPGSPLFDTKGRLVALVVERVGRIGSRALPMARVQAELTAAAGHRSAGAGR